jgi:hypothetical protein
VCVCVCVCVCAEPAEGLIEVFSVVLEGKYLIVTVFFIFSGPAAQRGLWPPRPRGFVITHNDAPQSIGRLLTSDQLVAFTST